MKLLAIILLATTAMGVVVADNLSFAHPKDRGLRELRPHIDPRPSEDTKTTEEPSEPKTTEEPDEKTTTKEETTKETTEETTTTTDETTTTTDETTTTTDDTTTTTTTTDDTTTTTKEKTTEDPEDSKDCDSDLEDATGRDAFSDLFLKYLPGKDEVTFMYSLKKDGEDKDDEEDKDYEYEIVWQGDQVDRDGRVVTFKSDKETAPKDLELPVVIEFEEDEVQWGVDGKTRIKKATFTWYDCTDDRRQLHQFLKGGNRNLEGQSGKTAGYIERKESSS